MMYILGYLRIFFYNINTLQFKRLVSVKLLKKCLMLIKAVAYLFDKKNNWILFHKIILWKMIAI